MGAVCTDVAESFPHSWNFTPESSKFFFRQRSDVCSRVLEQFHSGEKDSDERTPSAT